MSFTLPADDPDRFFTDSPEIPDMHQAHRFHYSPDSTLRQAIEARLLTSETYDETAARFAATPRAIEYIEQVFFNVRDRLQCVTEHP
jgi:hypothetical protein